MENILHLSWQVLVSQIIAFAILVWVLGKFLFRPIQGILAARQDEVRGTLEQVAADRRAMEQSRRDYEQRLATIEGEARDRIQAALKEAQALKEEVIASAQSESEKIIRRGEEEIRREKQKALVELREEVADMAVMAAGKILGSAIDERQHRALIQDFVGKVGTS
jgi:F-type H+-transporting ATPase subunit b